MLNFIKNKPTGGNPHKQIKIPKKIGWKVVYFFKKVINILSE